MFDNIFTQAYVKYIEVVIDSLIKSIQLKLEIIIKEFIRIVFSINYKIYLLLCHLCNQLLLCNRVEYLSKSVKIESK